MDLRLKLAVVIPAGESLRFPLVLGDPYHALAGLRHYCGQCAQILQQAQPFGNRNRLAGKEAGRVICFVRDSGVGFEMRCARKLLASFCGRTVLMNLKGLELASPTRKRPADFHRRALQGG
jgi:hypothetical protein